MKIRKIFDIFKFSLLIIPVIPGKETKTIRFNIGKILLALVLYSVVFTLMAILFVSLTPAKSFLFIYETAETKQQARETAELRRRVDFLTKEMNNILSLNKNLQFAVYLGDSTLLDSMNKYIKQDSAKKKSPEIGGNVFYIAKKIFFNKNENQEKPQNEVNFISPVRGFISLDFNPSHGHMGIDYALKMNTPIVAAASGYVVFADYTVNDGYMIILAHEENYITLYKHCASLSKRMRERAVQGEVIALSGNSGDNTTGPHLHFEIWKNGRAIDPKKILINY